MKKLIFLDDERNIEDVTWINYPDYEDVFVIRRMCDFIFVFIEIYNEIENYDFSFDHDIQDYTYNEDEKYENTGYDIVKWMIDFVIDNNINISKCNFFYHTQNTIGKENMQSYINNYLKSIDG